MRCVSYPHHMQNRQPDAISPQPREEKDIEKAERRLLKRQEQRKRKIEEAGIKYDFEAVAYVSDSPTVCHLPHLMSQLLTQKKKPKPTEA